MATSTSTSNIVKSTSKKAAKAVKVIEPKRTMAEFRIKLDELINSACIKIDNGINTKAGFRQRLAEQQELGLLERTVSNILRFKRIKLIKFDNSNSPEQLELHGKYKWSSDLNIADALRISSIEDLSDEFRLNVFNGVSKMGTPFVSYEVSF